MGTASSRPPAQPGAGAAAERAGAPPAPSGVTNEPMMLEPSEAEVDAWAERVRRQREGWLSGPTAEERAAWAQQERERRLGRLQAPSATEASEPGRLGAYYLREAQLAAEGAVRLVWKEVAAEGAMGAFRKWSRRGLDTLVRAGREWEEEVAQPGPRRPVPLDEQGP